MKQTIDHETDVLVVGTGPMGATTALALATYGVRVHVISKANWLANTPRAHITNQRAVEVLRDLGVEDEARKHATPWEWMGDTLFTTSLAGPEIARLRTWGTGDERVGDYLQGSPCTMLDIPQSYMEPVLVHRAAERGARVSFNTEYLSHEQDVNGVTVTIRDVTSRREYQVRARYLVGADGARSKIIDDLGLPIEGHLARAATAYILFNADLTRFVAHRPSILYWMVTSSASFGEIGLGLLRAIRPWNQWIAGWGFDPSKGDPDFSPEEVTKKIHMLIGDPKVKVDIDSTSVWYVNQASAPTYSKGRVFCGGDAVHRHPPSSGLGSNTCLQDAFNLAWKLAYVVKGYAGERLLDSYSLERASVGAQVVARANQSRLDYAPLNACFREKGAADPVAAGVAELQSASADGEHRRELLAAALRVKDFEFNAQGIEMNQRCVSGAVVPDADAIEETWKRDARLYLQPTTRPGAKLPHAWVVDERGHRVSTLDLVGKGKFTVLTGLSGQVWGQAAASLGLPFLRSVVIGTPEAQDLYFTWHRAREIRETGVVLVRPDGVVAWRHDGAASDVSTAKRIISEALSKILGPNACMART
jgi:2,4-dichlorophenol 6-monooxygenase